MVKAEKIVRLSSADMAFFNLNTRSSPIFLSHRGLLLVRLLYRHLPILSRNEGQAQANPWQLKFSQGIFNMTSKSRLFPSQKSLEGKGSILRGNVFVLDNAQYLPIYEGKMIHHFNPRWASCAGDQKLQFRDSSAEELLDPLYAPLPRYWVEESVFVQSLQGKLCANTAKKDAKARRD